mmetsp:Transcript_5646/g.11932  ORF Transcript_5646/g.11932 Transcript_5646/m.11932 type:complete len:80 (+) Transcript_5646:676-915(+)
MPPYRKKTTTRVEILQDSPKDGLSTRFDGASFMMFIQYYTFFPFRFSFHWLAYGHNSFFPLTFDNQIRQSDNSGSLVLS